MPLQIKRYILGPLENNTYLLTDTITSEAIVIDPSDGAEVIAEDITRHEQKLVGIWVTHAHFDHIAGVNGLVKALPTPTPIGLHPLDRDLWTDGGGAHHFGYRFDPGPKPTVEFSAGQKLLLGAHAFEVRHTPGHTPGHVLFYNVDAGLAFVGDLIFRRGVGRTDLPGGDEAALIRSIRTQVFTLPPATRLLPGHGEETTAGAETTGNPSRSFR
ncbi:MAG: MBL fold metallo-hydrolase [Anaerolineaceae bacterium]|nr:MBL fold metallo-hydrolase [Anaerolineaceae bacterium]